MSAVAMLPDDLLSETLCLAAGSSIPSKFAVAQVSARWRRVALSSPLLWTHIAVSFQYGISEFWRLPLVLLRTGLSALLDIKLDGQPFNEMDARLAEVLIPYAARIRVLDAILITLDDLVMQHLEFPALEILRVSDCELTELHLTAPNLRELVIADIPWSAFAPLLSARLETVKVSYCPGAGYAALVKLLELCPNAVHLSFEQYDTKVFSFDIVDGGWNLSPLRMLETLSLAISYRQLVQVLDSALGHAVVIPRTVTVEVLSNHDDQEIIYLWTMLLRGMGPLVEFARESNDLFSLRDAAGRERTMIIKRYDTSLHHVWRLLAEKYGAQDTVRQISISTFYWNEFPANFAAHPPHANQVLRFYDLREDDGSWTRTRRILPPRGELALPGLRRVEFYDLGLASFWQGNVASIILRALQSIACDAGRIIEVAVDCSEKWKEVRDTLERNGDGRWKLVEWS